MERTKVKPKRMKRLVTAWCMKHKETGQYFYSSTRKTRRDCKEYVEFNYSYFSLQDIKYVKISITEIKKEQ